MNVRKSFEGLNIFITGGSGFIGKVLIEKILRSIPGVGNIYILLRSRKGKSVTERLEDILENRLFDTLKQENPSVLKKVIAIEGDVQQLKLGIDEKSRKILIEDVDIVYHCAASVRFDEDLSSAIISNIRSTREVIELSLKMNHLKAFIHVSTAYCNSDKTTVEEKIYPAHGDWEEAIRIAEMENVNSNIINSLTQKYINPLCNTYIYAKSLAEHVVNDMCNGKLPAAIVRPTIVINIYQDPLPGWTDNLNGPVGIYVGAGLGLLRVLLLNTECVMDYVPVDAVVNAIILAGAQTLNKQNLNYVEVYNASNNLSELTTKQQSMLAQETVKNFPFSRTIWYPNSSLTESNFYYYVNVVLFHVLPALLVDTFMMLAGKKPMLFKLQKKIYLSNVILVYFMSHTWNFKNSKTLQLESELSPKETDIFGFGKSMITSSEQFWKYIKICIVGVEKDLFKRDYDVEKNRRRNWRLWVLDRIVRIAAACLFIWLFFKYDIMRKLFGIVENYISNL